jgi:hypothetical protein
MRKLLWATVVALALALGALLGTNAIGARHVAIAPTLDGLDDAQFVSLCRFSHRAPDDPIVLPNQPGYSHDHTFFGSTATNAYSTPDSLRGTRTTCNRVEDTAAYWAPTLVVDDKAVAALDAAIYYRRTTIARVQPFPANLVMVAGNSKSTDPQSTSVVYWNCDLHGTDISNAPVNCGNRSLRMHVVFPECWDGLHLDSADHKAHMAYAANGVCPADHPVAVPQIIVNIRYPVNGAGHVEVSSMGPYSGHADFVNSWDEAGLTRLVDYCLNALRPCDTGPA